MEIIEIYLQLPPLISQYLFRRRRYRGRYGRNVMPNYCISDAINLKNGCLIDKQRPQLPLIRILHNLKLLSIEVVLDVQDALDAVL